MDSLSRLGVLLRESGLRPPEVVAVAEAFKKNQCVQTLDLSSNSIGRPGAEALSAAFMLNSTLTAVDLSACGIDAASSASLVHALRHMPCLASLSLSENNVGDAAGSVIAAWLNASPRLARLALSRCGFTKSTAVKLGDALERNRWLTDLDLSWNHLGEEGGRAVAQALSACCLQSVNLSFASIGDETALLGGRSGLQAVCAIGGEAGEVASVLLGGCVPAKGAPAFEVALAARLRRVSPAEPCTAPLAQLVLAHNPLSITGTLLLARSISTSTTLRLLDLTQCSTGSGPQLFAKRQELHTETVVSQARLAAEAAKAARKAAGKSKKRASAPSPAAAAAAVVSTQPAVVAAPCMFHPPTLADLEAALEAAVASNSGPTVLLGLLS